jgi:NAD-dependent SIR2 family protein deacetylase
MAVTVLLSILFQSVHSYEHFHRHIAEFCHEHQEPGDKPFITHHHDSNYEDCGICDFVFSAFTSVDVHPASYISFTEISAEPVIQSPQTVIFFKGSLFAHRGPPSV